MNKLLKRTLTYTALITSAWSLGGLSHLTQAQSISSQNIVPSRNNALQKQNTNTLNNSNYATRFSSNTNSISSSNNKPKNTNIKKYKSHKNKKMRKHNISLEKINMKNARSLPLLKMNKPILSYQMHHHTLNLTNHQINQGTLVKPNNMIQTHHKIYMNIYRMGHNLGWVNINNLNRTNTYSIPYRYTSQFWPSKAKDACEIASLKTAMSTDGKGNNIQLAPMVQKIPLNNNANLGYTGDPFHYGTHASIYPPAMVNIAKQYGAKGKVLNNKNTNTFIYYVTHGNPVVYESPFMMKRPYSDHDLTIVGYKPGYFYVVDPFSAYRSSKRATWVSIARFNYLFKSNKRNQHALVIFTK